jgi:hypothetical protein
MQSLEISPLVQPVFSKLNYSGLLLMPRKIYYEWSRYVIPEMDYFNENGAEFFLLPQFNSPEKTEEFCKLFFDLFFQYKLRKCSNDPAFWPINRTFEMFQDWFEVRITYAVSSLT